uniref:Uncharacterized protein n=1 Tax=Physarum polycephalum TaxID=5791 RepID=Q9MJ80_PHYPO|nr:hypothetical protein PhpooMp03 [Physarum polycephalum]BAB08082.1 unnamed protein product [Physarum polycephalum]
MKNIINKIRYIYIILLLKLLYNPIIFFLIYYVIIIGIQILWSYYMHVEVIKDNDNNLLKTLPSIKIIHNYFLYKSSYLYEAGSICKSLYKIMPTTKYSVVKDIILVKYSLDTSADYQPSQDEASYFPSDDINDMIPVQMQDIPVKSKEPKIEYPRRPNIDLKRETIIPRFEIETETIPPTIVNPPDVINNDLPFEEPVEEPIEIKVEFFNAYTDLMNIEDVDSVISPSFEGSRIYSDDAIFQLHLDITEFVTQKIRVSTEDISVTIIRNTVHEYFIKSNLNSNLTPSDLQNTNHLINLLLKELIVNSFFAADNESFIMKQIATSLIVEVLSNLENVDSNCYYDNPDILDGIVQDIVTRFTKQ